MGGSEIIITKPPALSIIKVAKFLRNSAAESARLSVRPAYPD